MNFSFLLRTDAWVISLFLFVFMLVFIWLGAQTGIYKKKHYPVLTENQFSPNTGNLSNLLFFMLAFTFGMSTSRFDMRRVTVVQEANIIGTAVLRADLYPEEERQLFRQEFKEYIAARISYLNSGTNIAKIISADSLSQAKGRILWDRAARLSHDISNAEATRQMVPALNEMIDIITTRKATDKAKVPESITWMLFAMSIIYAFYSGYSAGIKGKIDWIIETGFSLLVAIAIYFILDLDRPRRGLVTMDNVNETLRALQNMID